MNTRTLRICGALGLALASARAPAATNYTVLGWNNLGMHCMDSDYSVFSILPPYNTIHAQVVMTINGNTAKLLTNGALALSYEAMADADGSINRTSQGKTTFWSHVQPLFGVSLPTDTGLPVPGPNSWVMPGVSNVPQALAYETNQHWYAAYGIPIAPYDDAGRPNQYPMMRLRLKSGAATLDTTDIVLPVSDEMDCRMCHLSGSGPDAAPAAGWVNDPNPGRDYRLNVLRLHDESEMSNALFRSALATHGFSSNGLLATARGGRPILCAACHLSEALPGSGITGLSPLTRAMHHRHAAVTDPRNGLALDAVANRVSCYTCHPGSATRCLRGAMGKAVAADGSMSMQCQSCHGGMAEVGSELRTGWLEEPNCQACHVGSATNTFGAIRFATAFTTGGVMRVPADRRFATSADTPAPGLSLYRFSTGHGGLQCAACHGSTHAEFPSAVASDNVQNESAQGHAGTLVECTVCHGTQPNTVSGGPHGMHPLGTTWIENHGDDARAGPGVTQCKACHGADYRGTVLSRSHQTRTVSTKFGSRTYWRGYQIGCYNCHNGVNSSDAMNNTAPVVTGRATNTPAGVALTLGLRATDANGQALTLRVVDQPPHGTVALSGTNATYYPETGWTGTNRFTFAAWDGYADSNLGAVTVVVARVDADADGMPDWWTRVHFGHALGVSNDLSRAGDDPDLDGLSNAQEQAAGTDPLDERSAPRIFGFARNGTNVEGRVATALGQRFLVQQAASLNGPWVSAGTNIWGQQDSIPFSAGVSAGTFYRLVAPAP
jgi:hypothetical protein